MICRGNYRVCTQNPLCHPEARGRAGLNMHVKTSPILQLTGLARGFQVSRGKKCRLVLRSRSG